MLLVLIPGVSAAPVNSATSATVTTDPFNDLRIYQVMVSSFQSGSSVGYGVGWGPNTTRHDGDLQGIINALDYIKSTGVNALWMTPVFDSTGSNVQDKTASTGYFCTDYFNVDPKYGGNNVFRELVNKAHEKGLYIILDGVFGHHGGNVKASPTGKKPSGGSNPVSYPGSLDFYKEVAEYWIKEYKIDGWRLDQCYQVSTRNQDRNYWKDIRESVESACAANKAKGETWGTLGYMVGEDWNGESSIASVTYNCSKTGAMGLKSAFDFPTRYRVVQAFAQEESGKSTGDAAELNRILNVNKSVYPNFAQPNLFLTNHDVLRVGDLIRWKYGYAQENTDYWKRHKAMLSFMAQYTGPITLYYGDEIGDYTPGYNNPGDLGAYNDNVARTNGKITGFNDKETDLYKYVQNIMQIRAQNPAFSNGTRTNLIATSNIFADYKVFGDNRVVYIVNTSTSAQTATFQTSKVDGTTAMKNLETGETVSASGGNYNISVPALSALFLKVSTDEPTYSLGDVNRDNSVTLKDATTIQKHLVKLVDLDSDQLLLADVNRDGDVSLKDATHLQKFLVGLIPDLE